MYLYKTIPIENVYYMLSYISGLAFERRIIGSLRTDNRTLFSYYVDFFSEELKKIVQQGLYKTYINYDEPLYTVRGQIVLSDSLRLKGRGHNTIVCDFDELSIDNIHNSIIKAVIELLLFKYSNMLLPEQKKKLYTWGVFWGDVQSISLRLIDWDKIQYNRQNIRYRMILFWGQLITEAWLLCTDEDNFELPFINHQSLCNLFEKFVFMYCKHYCSNVYPDISVSARQMEWCNSDKGEFMPIMRTDILLHDSRACKALIIDTKFYKQIFTSRDRGNKKVFRSNNLYQIFSYIMHYKYNHIEDNISGLLLYAGIQDEMNGKKFFEHNVCDIQLDVEILDLSASTDRIEYQLKDMIQRYFGKANSK